MLLNTYRLQSCVVACIRHFRCFIMLTQQIFPFSSFPRTNGCLAHFSHFLKPDTSCSSNGPHHYPVSSQYVQVPGHSLRCLTVKSMVRGSECDACNLTGYPRSPEGDRADVRGGRGGPGRAARPGPLPCRHAGPGPGQNPPPPWGFALGFNMQTVLRMLAPTLLCFWCVCRGMGRMLSTGCAWPCS